MPGGTNVMRHKLPHLNVNHKFASNNHLRVEIRLCLDIHIARPGSYRVGAEVYCQYCQYCQYWYVAQTGSRLGTHPLFWDD